MMWAQSNRFYTIPQFKSFKITVNLRSLCSNDLFMYIINVEKMNCMYNYVIIFMFERTLIISYAHSRRRLHGLLFVCSTVLSQFV